MNDRGQFEGGGRHGAAAPRRQRGITLIELMIVVVIVAVLGAIAVPSYTNYVTRSNRTEALNQLLETAACQERIYIKFNEYDDSRCNLVSGKITTNNGHYEISMTETDSSQGFDLDAVPQGAQATRDTDCGTLSLDQAGVRTISGGGDINACWRGKKG